MKILSNSSLLLSISTFALAASAQEPSTSPLFGTDEELVGTTAHVEGQLIVRFDRRLEAEEAPLTLQQGRYVLEEPLVPELGLYLYLIADGRSVADGIRELRLRDDVRYAQANHLVSSRSTQPNDPSFGQQWCHLDPQDDDMDTVLAWDIATGSGDQVVAIVDGGGMHNHADLIGNRWQNDAEVNGQAGVDDDFNGYVDDMYGWDAYNDDGTIPADSHGTHVGGIVGAQGNNGTGVAGVNWNCGLMWVAASSTQTATVLKGYNYIYMQKALHLLTGGQMGANVVAANSSFGIDFADCSSNAYASWNDMYDLLGSVGVLSCVATANLAINVDVSGDVPSSCTSPFVVAVTNTTSSDTLNGSAAWGVQSIDMGAPGTSILSTVPAPGAWGLPGSGYALDSGTSMATPQVSGVVALMHDAASQELSALFQLDPPAAALQMKALLLGAIDPIGALAGITTTGGRLNAFKAVHAASNFHNVPNIMSTSPSQLPAVVVDGPGIVQLTGLELTYVTRITVAGEELSPSSWSLVSDQLIELEMPQVGQLGAAHIRAENDLGQGDSTWVWVVANDTPALDVMPPAALDFFPSAHASVRVGGAPGTLHFICVSTSLAPTNLPGIASLAIGANNTSLVLLDVPVIDADGFEDVSLSVPLPPGHSWGFPLFTDMHFQVAMFDPAVGWPLIPSNVETATFLH